MRADFTPLDVSYSAVGAKPDAPPRSREFHRDRLAFIVRYARNPRISEMARCLLSLIPECPTQR